MNFLAFKSDAVKHLERHIDQINYDASHPLWIKPKGLTRKTAKKLVLLTSFLQNPLLFTFPPDIDEESLITGAEQLSQAVLASDVEIVRPNPDLTRQIMERRERLRFLIGFINENGALGKVIVKGSIFCVVGVLTNIKMSQSSRQRLTLDAERLYASEQLWHMYCHRVKYVILDNNGLASC